MKKKIVSLLLTAALLFSVQEMPVSAGSVTDGNEIENTGTDTPANPVHHCEAGNKGNDYTDWSYVYFGSYPQTEVTGDDLTQEITGARYDAKGDAWVNGTKYRRAGSSDANNTKYFGDSNYRYFKWERIKWRVMQNNGSTLFVVADRGLDCKDYNETRTSVTWEDCTLRAWLNETFYNTAFSGSEQGAIVPQTVVNDDNPEYGTEGGQNTQDKIYLLSISEVLNPEYGFCKERLRMSAGRWMKASDYTHAMGGVIEKAIGTEEVNCWWWLRSPGNYEFCAASANQDGYIYQYGVTVDTHDGACLPALHINLSSDLWYTSDDGTSGEGGGEDQSPDLALNVAKEQSKNELEFYKDMDSYREAQKKELSDAVAAGKAAIEAAEDEEAVQSALAAAKAAIDQIKTDEQMTAEESMARLKESGMEELERYKDAHSYREAQQEELANAITAGKAAIEAAEDEEDVRSALAAAKKAIDKIKTDEQMAAEESAAKLVQIKEDSKGELESYKDADSYREAQKKELSDAVAAGKAAIEAAEDKAAVWSALAAAKAAIDKIKTDAQLVLEEQKYIGGGTTSEVNSEPTEKIVSKATSIKGKIKAKSKGFLVKWKKAASVTGYQIQYSASRKFTKKTTKIKTVKKASQKKLTVKKLKASKKYYVRIRTYKTVDGKNYYSAWSKAKSVKTKK